MKNNRNYIDIIIRILWVGVILACIKSIFADTGFDNGYTVAMAYRHINGDAMFTEMWEPHQTSMFVVEILMRIYRIFVPSYTGVVVFLQLCGTLINGFVCHLLYKLLKKVSDKTTANLACMFYMLFNVKQSPFPDYAGMQIAFSVLLFIYLVKFLESAKVKHLIAAAVFLCLEVLAYPSCIIAYAAVIAILGICSSRRLRDMLIFTAACGVIGLVYTGYFVIRVGFGNLLLMVNNIFLADSHSTTPDFYESYLQGFPIIIIWLAISFGAAFLTHFIVKKYRENTWSLFTFFGIYAVIYHFAILVLQKKIGTDFYCAIYIIPISLMILAGFGYKRLTPNEKTVWLTGILISAASFFSTQLLTDLGLITVLAYLVLGGVVSFIPISHMKKETIGFLISVCVCVIVHRGLVVWGYGNKWGVNLVYEVENVVRSGPSAGVVCDYMTYYMTEENTRDHSLYIGSDDTFLLVDTWVFDPVEFLLPAGEIANPTTIDTPIFNENTLEYFRCNPSKTPSVIAVSCWYGNLKLEEDSFIMQWIYENYHPVGDGSYWRYYRRN